MAKQLLDKIYRYLLIVVMIMGILFGVFLVGHAGYLIYEYLKDPQKSKERWEKIEQKFRSHPVVNVYVLPSSLLSPTSADGTS